MLASQSHWHEKGCMNRMLSTASTWHWHLHLAHDRPVSVTGRPLTTVSVADGRPCSRSARSLQAELELNSTSEVAWTASQS